MLAYWDGGEAVADRARDNDWTEPAAVPSIVPALPHDFRENLPPGPRPKTSDLFRCPEIDCVRHLLPPLLVAKAEWRAAEVGVGADRVLIAWGVISEETYAAALAASLDIAFEPLFNTPRQQCLLPDDRLHEAANTGMLPLADRNGVKIVVTPRLVDSRRLVAVAASGADVARRIRITSSARLREFVARHSASEIEHRAVDDLRTRYPVLSAGAVHSRWWVKWACIAIATLGATAVPGAAMIAVEILLGSVFLAWTGLRLLGLLSERYIRRQPQTFSNHWLPIYSIVVALYREAATVPDLVAALRALDYPGIRAQTPQAI